jgi:hypothetical protein
MADITVTIPNSTFTIDTISNGIEVTTPTSVEVNVDSNSNTIDITNTPQEITVLTSGTLNITTTDTDRLVAGSNQVILNTNATMTFPNNVIDFGSQTADLKSSSYSELWYRNATATPPPGQGIQTYIWAWENQAGIAVESVDNGYKEWFFNADATTQFPNYKFPAADGIANQILKTNGSGVLAWYSPSDANTTYTQNISATSGGANLNLVGSDSTTDTVKFADGTGVTVSYTDASTATISIGQSVGTTDAVTFGSVNIDSRALLDTATLTTSTTSANQVVDSFTAATYRTAKYLISISSGTDYQSVELLVVHNGTTASQTTYADVMTNTDLAAFTVDISGANVRLLTTPVNAVTAYKVTRTAIVV